VIDNATVVVSQPLPVVEAMVRDVSGWAALFSEVEDVARLARNRYLVHLRRGRRVLPAVLRVQRDSTEHRIGWHTVTGPTWSGRLHLVALTGRRTAVHLTFDRTTLDRTPLPAVPAVPAVPSRSLAGSLGGSLGGSLQRWWARWRAVLPGTGVSARARLVLSGQAKRDLRRLRERVDVLPRPIRPVRLGPLPGARPVEDVLVIDGLRRDVPPAAPGGARRVTPSSADA
jgi:hypothetical protein